MFYLFIILQSPTGHQNKRKWYLSNALVFVNESMDTEEPVEWPFNDLECPINEPPFAFVELR